MIRLIFCVVCWVLLSIPAAVIGFPALYLTGSIDLLWKLSLWAASTGYRLAGIRVRTVGREKLGRGARISLHVQSRLKPGPADHYFAARPAHFHHRQAGTLQDSVFWPRHARWRLCRRRIAPTAEAAVESVREAATVLQSGMGMLVFPEGTRSPDGKLLPFKKGPFHVAMEAGVPVVPITIAGSYEAWPKGTMSLSARERLW